MRDSTPAQIDSGLDRPRLVRLVARMAHRICRKHLSQDAIAAAWACSRATVQKLFDVESGRALTIADLLRIPDEAAQREIIAELASWRGLEVYRRPKTNGRAPAGVAGELAAALAETSAQVTRALLDGHIDEDEAEAIYATLPRSARAIAAEASTRADQHGAATASLHALLEGRP